MKPGLIFFSAFVLLFAMTGPAAALKISPFKAIIVPGGTATTQVFRIDNNSSESAAVQVSMLTWDMSPEGHEINRDAENDFVVFPAQVILKPHENRAVRIQWLGTEKPAVEKSYRVLAEQIPVSLKDTAGFGSAIRFMLRFKAALYIAPNAPSSNVTVENIKILSPGTASVTLFNKGTVHTLLHNPVLHLNMADGRTVTLTSAMLKAINGENIHAGSERVFALNLPAGPSGQIAAAHLDFEPAF